MSSSSMASLTFYLASTNPICSKLLVYSLKAAGYASGSECSKTAFQISRTMSSSCFSIMSLSKFLGFWVDMRITESLSRWFLAKFL